MMRLRHPHIQHSFRRLVAAYAMPPAVLLVFTLLCSTHLAAQPQIEKTVLPAQSRSALGKMHQIFHDRDGYVWYATADNGLMRDNGYQIDLFNRTTTPTLGSNNILSICQDSVGNIWVATSKGLYRLNASRHYTVESITQPPFHEGRITALTCTHDGNVWAASRRAIACFNNKGQMLRRLTSDNVGDGSKSVSAFYEDSRHRLWMLECRRGLQLYDAAKGEFRPVAWPYEEPIFLHEDAAHHCFWVGTWGGGIYRFEPDLKPMLIERQEASDDGIFNGRAYTISLVQPRPDRLLLTHMGGMDAFSINPDGTLVLSPLGFDMPASDCVLDLMNIDRHGNVWVSGIVPRSFVLKEKETTREINGTRRFDDLASKMLTTTGHRLNATYVLQRGDTLCFWQFRIGMAIYNLRTGRLHIEPVDNYDVNGKYITGIYFDHQGKPNVHVSRQDPSSRPLPTVTDSHGHVWKITNQTLTERNPQTGSIHVIHPLDDELGMDYINCISLAGDSILVGGVGNISALSPLDALDHYTSTPLRPLVSTIMLDTVKLCLAPNCHKIDLPAYVNNTTLFLTTLDPLNASSVTFAYRLKGVSEAWTTLPRGENTIQLVMLSKGTYQLELRATDDNGVWSAPMQVLTLHRLPAWWETWWAYTAYVLLIAAAIFAIQRLYLRRQKAKRTVQMEQQLADMKMRFFTNISHELRTPLTMIVTPLDTLCADPSLAAHHTTLSLMQRNANHLLTLINRLLEFRKLEMQQERPHLSLGDLSDLVRTATASFSHMAIAHGIKLSCNTVPDDGQPLLRRYDPQQMQHILFNLISNALKYTPDGGQVSVSLSLAEDGQTVLTVSDTGMGISPDDLPHIFDRYYRATSTSSTTGTGIGLSIVKECVKMHGGTITAESTVGKGTVFRVSLPLHEEDKGETEEVVREVSTSQRPSLLLVEDNAEFRTWMSNELRKAGYDILEASDGEEALATVAANPDISIIVSDVMMPRMDGNELTRQIKSNLQTSHIPIILLTAKSGDESMLMGYNAGADLYLTKPFSMSLLLDRIRHLFEQHQQRSKIFLESVDIKSDEVATNERDREFVESAVRAVERNLNNVEYSVEQFADDLCMSRANLFRKLRALTQQSPSEFIRTIRLKHAARLILIGKLPINEISDFCGFSSPSYFNRVFKEMFGCPPGQYK